MKNLITVFLFLFTSSFLVNAQEDRAEAGKSITISARGIPEEDMAKISGSYVVDKASGTIRMPYLPSPVYVKGKTGRQIEDMLTNAYLKADIYTSPIFNVTLTTDAAAMETKFVQVGGYVASKRNIPYRQGLTLYQAILDAGDITEFGSRNILVTRAGKTEKYNYFSVKDRALILMPGDQVTVTQRGVLEGRPNGLQP